MHIARELATLVTSHFASNRRFAQQILPIIHRARIAYRDYHLIVEAQLSYMLNHLPAKGWASDAQGLAHRLGAERHGPD
jgi:hypothetical protein